jgi:hypothetical protein
MTYMRLAEDFIGKTVSVVRTQGPPMRGELIETSSDGIIVKAGFQEDGLHAGKLGEKRIFIPWSAVQGIS